MQNSGLLAPNSAVTTMERVGLTQLIGHAIDEDVQHELIAFFSGLQRRGRGLFARVPGEAPPARLLTGEPLVGDPRIYLGHEIALCLRRMPCAAGLPVMEELDRALLRALARPPARGDICGRLALWRHAAYAGGPRAEAVLEEELQALRASRDGRGRWEGWPFLYTLLALSGMPRDLGAPEIAYALPACRRTIARIRAGGRAKIRRYILMSVLAREQARESAAGTAP